uniref:Uncharacterized protein n=1 Tax=Timema shepardi TaxID=629360 RepID=A0A7R9AP45_TIMSH|nr:unnamed protein product [Timema shepardi]
MRYCTALPQDKFTILTPSWYLHREKTNAYLQLPISSPLRILVEGPEMTSRKQAKRAVALETCRLLYEMGELDKNLMPKTRVFEDSKSYKELFPLWEDESPVKVGEKTVYPGTKNMKRQYPHKEVMFLISHSSSMSSDRMNPRSGDWAPPVFLSECRPQEGQTAHLHVIQMKPVYQRPPPSNNRKMVFYDLLNSEKHGWALLSSKPLPKVCRFPIYMNVGELEINLICNANSFQVSDEQVKMAQKLNTMLFTELLHKLYKNFLVVDQENKEQSYFIVPIVKEENREQLWQLSSCYRLQALLRQSSAENWFLWSQAYRPRYLRCICRNGNIGKYVVDWTTVEKYPHLPSIKPPNDEQRLALTFDKKSLEQTVIIPWYRGKFAEQNYIVTRVCEDLSAQSSFPTEDYMSYADYFDKKYGLKVLRPNQPLIEVKAISNKLNCLRPRGIVSNSAGKRKRQELQEDFEEHLIPELCMQYTFPAELWLKATALPTILHRVTYLLMAEELRQTLSQQIGIGALWVVRSGLIELATTKGIKERKGRRHSHSYNTRLRSISEVAARRIVIDTPPGMNQGIGEVAAGSGVINHQILVMLLEVDAVPQQMFPAAAVFDLQGLADILNCMREEMTALRTAQEGARTAAQAGSEIMRAVLETRLGTVQASVQEMCVSINETHETFGNRLD